MRNVCGEYVYTNAKYKNVGNACSFENLIHFILRHYTLVIFYLQIYYKIHYEKELTESEKLITKHICNINKNIRLDLILISSISPLRVF